MMKKRATHEVGNGSDRALGAELETRGRRWAIILAGGEGTRLSPFVRQWLGSHRPKQYCAFTGKKSMLEHTFARAVRLVPAERILTVIGAGHRRYLDGDGGSRISGRILEQPANLDTAPGVFLPLAHVMASDPQATVLVFPSDHFISPLESFLKILRKAADSVELSSDRVLLLGAVPDRPESEYGWVKAATAEANGSVAPVAGFREKPGPEEAAAFFGQGQLWNTLIMAAKAETLWELGRLCLPEMVRGFEALFSSFGTPQEAAALSSAYARMKPANFSKHILECRPERAGVMPLREIAWSDWGRPARILETLERMRLQPAFPPMLAAQSLEVRA